MNAMTGCDKTRLDTCSEPAAVHWRLLKRIYCDCQTSAMNIQLKDVSRPIKHVHQCVAILLVYNTNEFFKLQSYESEQYRML